MCWQDIFDEIDESMITSNWDYNLSGLMNSIEVCQNVAKVVKDCDDIIAKVDD
jgi:hypothetical protein